MNRLNEQSDTKPLQDTQPVLRTADEAFADFVRLVMATFKISAAVNRRDPFGCAVGMAEVIVYAVDRERAMAAIEELRHSQHASDWTCPRCDENVPQTFDLCWNCGQLHPDLEESAQLRTDQECDALPTGKLQQM
jgi:hypothetical protein